jgi:hypothetical protein
MNVVPLEATQPLYFLMPYLCDGHANFCVVHKNCAIYSGVMTQTCN